MTLSPVATASAATVRSSERCLLRGGIVHFISHAAVVHVVVRDDQQRQSAWHRSMTRQCGFDDTTGGTAVRLGPRKHVRRVQVGSANQGRGGVVSWVSLYAILTFQFAASNAAVSSSRRSSNETTWTVTRSRHAAQLAARSRCLANVVLPDPGNPHSTSKQRLARVL